jgi:glycosyltransferase involved in cell wall biosynthesis
LQAFALFKSSTHAPHKLILAGAFFWGKKEIERTLDTLPCRGDIIFTGRVDDDTLSRLTAGADALTYTPLFEGFGVPLIEAMACDIPILSSDRSALPEIAGMSALYVDPLNVDNIAQAMERITTDTALRATLIAAGQKQCTKFSWDASAKELWRVIQDVL